MRHASARNLALHVTNHWNDTPLSELSTVIDPGPGDFLPDQDTLDHLISCCYQASLMRAPLLQSRPRARLEFVWSLDVLLDFSSWHALGEFLDEGFIFLLTAGQIGW
jgi:hypothetical protein